MPRIKNCLSAHTIREIIVKNSRDYVDDWESCTVQGPIKVTRNCVLYKARITDQQLAIKVFHPQHTSPGQVKKYYKALCDYHANMDSDQGLFVPRPYKAIQEQRILVMDWIPCPSLGSILLRPDFCGTKRENCIRAAGKWLQRFHNAGGVKALPLDTQPMLDKLQATVQRAQHTKQSCDKNSKLEQVYKVIHPGQFYSQ